MADATKKAQALEAIAVALETNDPALLAQAVVAAVVLSNPKLKVYEGVFVLGIQRVFAKAEGTSQTPWYLRILGLS